MKNRKFCAFVLALIIAASNSYGQKNLFDLGSVFGKRVGTECADNQKREKTETCEQYEYNENFLVQINRNKRQEIEKIYLRPKPEVDESKGILTLAEKKKFLNDIGRVHSFGSLRLSGPYVTMVKSIPDFWDVYENAFVSGLYRYYDGKRSRLTHLTILFPFEITGTIEEIKSESLGLDKGGRIPLIYIEGCSYLAMDKNLKVGTTGTFLVVGPRNWFDGKCKDIELNWDLDKSKAIPLDS